jgi:hypothetical protein
MENTVIKKCAYCGKERPIEEMKQGTITFRNSKYDSRGKRKQFVDKKTNWYCNDTSCHGNDQMAHEG